MSSGTRTRIPLGISGNVLVLALLLMAAQEVQAQDGPSDLTSLASPASGIPRLFTPLPQAFSKGPLPEDVTSMERVSLDAEVLGFAAVQFNVEGHDLVAHRIDSEWRVSSESFVYRVEGEEPFSTFTKSYSGIVYGHIQAKGRSYFVSGEGGSSYLVVSSNPTLLPEVVHYPLMSEPISISTFAATSQMGRRRTVPSGASPPVVFINIAICLDYRDAVGGAERATARATHMIDRQNTAYRSSGFSGRMAIRDIYFIDPPQEVIAEGLWRWGIDSSGPIAENRRRTKAAGTLILSQGAQRREATRTALGPIFPDREVAISGNFFAEWSDGDILGTLHENGHLSGGDHNPESSTHGPDDPQRTARDWYSCEEAIYGLLSYNVCGRFLNRVEMYSGLNAIYAGKIRGNEMQNNVGMFARIFENMQGDHN